MKKTLKFLGLGLLLILIVLQFFKPEKNQSHESFRTDFILSQQPSPDLAQILKSACYDCHSNNTIYPWYNRISPVNFWLSNHIKEGKNHLNFSEWTNYPADRKARKLDACIEVLRKKEMPLRSYLLIHKEARLTEEQIKTLTSWLVSLEVN